MCVYIDIEGSTYEPGSPPHGGPGNLKTSRKCKLPRHTHTHTHTHTPLPNPSATQEPRWRTAVQAERREVSELLCLALMTRPLRPTAEPQRASWASLGALPGGPGEPPGPQPSTTRPARHTRTPPKTS